MKIGTGDLRYELVEDWERLPEGWSHPDVASVCTDSQGRTYLLCRAEHPVIVYDKDGNFLNSWGEGRFTLRTHGMYMTPEDELYIVDDAAHHVGQYSLSGELLRNIGPSGQPSDTGYDGKDIAGKTVRRGGPPYNRPTNLVRAASGDLFVSDGYGNSRVHHFSADGDLIKSWGEPGSGPGEFRLVHDIAIHPDGRIFVADSANDRLQIFNADGEYLTEWLDVQRPRGLFIDAEGLIYVGELVWRAGQVSERRGKRDKEEPSRMSVYDPDGTLILRWGGGDGSAPGEFVAPHGIWVDSEGSIYVAEVTNTIGVKPGFVPAGTHTFQKFARL
jgi:DNA-binding beta-propeller fold protein YncE